jgi:hypothetical protein
MNIGKPTHLTGNHGRTACGKRSLLRTGIRKDVNCYSCMKTKRYKLLKEFQKMFDKTVQITHCRDKVTATFHYRDTKAAFRHGTYE